MAVYFYRMTHLGRATDTSITDNTDGNTGGETGEADRETGTEGKETAVR